MKRKTANPRATDKIDRLIGENVRRIRLDRAMSQTTLGEQIGVTFQQVQKIEKGINRIAASRLYKVSKALETPIEQFFA